MTTNAPALGHELTQRDTSPAPKGHEKEVTQDTPPDPRATQIDRRTDLSVLYRIARTLIKPLRPRLVGLKGPLPQGSPQLTKRPHSHNGINITERRITVRSHPEVPLTQATSPEDAEGNTSQALFLYDFETPRSSIHLDRHGAKKEHRHVVYYFAGGGFQSGPTTEHWKLCARMAKELADSGISVVLVSYALAPNSPAKDSLPLLRNWLLEVLDEAQAEARADQTISLMGDSAGGNVVLSLAFWWSERISELSKQLQLEKETQDSKDCTRKINHIDALKRLKSVIAMSPATDFRNINPEIAKAAELDPILTMEVTESAADAWTKDWPHSGEAKADPVLSPALTPEHAWKTLKESTLRVDGLIGTADTLAPDAIVFMDKCKEHGITGKWLVWEGQMHCFPLIGCYGLREGREGLQWLCERVKEVV